MAKLLCSPHLNQIITASGNPSESLWASSGIRLGHIGLRPGLVDEDQPGRIKRRLALTPFRTRLGDVRPILLGRPERLFFSVRPSNFSVCHTSPTLAGTWCVANSHARNASIVVSPRWATCARIAA